MQLDEVGDVLRHDRPTLARGGAKQLAVRHPAEVNALARRLDVMTPAPQLASDLRREVLVQQEPMRHPRMARSRSAAARSRSAIA